MQETSDATAIFAPLWRRKWLILGVGIVVGVAAYLYYKQATPTFSASTQVYLGASAEEQAPGEKSQGKTSGVEVANQAAIINAIVVEQVRKDLKREGHGKLAKGTKVKAKAAEKSEFLTISAEGHTNKGTALMANRVAQAYIKRRNENRERSIGRAISLTRRQLARLEAAETPIKTSSSSSGKSGKSGGPSTSTILQSATLSSKINQLEANLAVSGAQQIKPAVRAELVAPAPRKDAIFGFVLGVVLAAIAAYLLGRLDRRLRTLEGIESIFRTQILAALPKVGHPIVYDNGQPRSSKLLLEPVRRLHMSLELGAVGITGAGIGPDATGLGAAGGAIAPSNGGESGAARPRKILFLSADPGDGKSTLVADLALVARDSGARVAVVEANFRRPVLAKRLGAADSDGYGLAEVLSGTHSIEEAIRRVAPPVADPTADPSELPASTAVALATHRAGSLFLLAGSKTVANPPALLAAESMPATIEALADEHDYVLIDAPSPLEFSDVMPVLRMVDGVVLVARAGHTREVSAQRFMQLLEHSTAAPVIGTVANCVSRSDIARQGLSSAGGRTWLGGLIRR